MELQAAILLAHVIAAYIAIVVFLAFKKLWIGPAILGAPITIPSVMVLTIYMLIAYPNGPARVSDALILYTAYGAPFAVAILLMR